MTTPVFKPKIGRPRKQREGILSEAQMEELLTPAQLAERNARRDAALKGKETRQRNAVVAAQKEAEEKMEQAASFPEYWVMQRANLTPDERARLEAREEDVLDIQYLMRSFLDGTYQTPRDIEANVTLPELIEEVQEQIAAHGITESIILVVDRLWTADQKNLRERIIAKGGPTVDLLRFGFRTGLDGQLVEEFRQRFQVQRVSFAPTNGILTCASCNTQISVHVSVLEGYKRLRVPHICQRCREVAAPVVEHTKETRSPESTIFDQWGRVKDR